MTIITQNELGHKVIYNHKTGFFYWIVDREKADIADNPNAYGHTLVGIFKTEREAHNAYTEFSIIK